MNFVVLFRQSSWKSAIATQATVKERKQPPDMCAFKSLSVNLVVASGLCAIPARPPWQDKVFLLPHALVCVVCNPCRGRSASEEHTDQTELCV